MSTSRLSSSITVLAMSALLVGARSVKRSWKSGPRAAMKVQVA
jgi:hypothetical protein